MKINDADVSMAIGKDRRAQLLYGSEAVASILEIRPVLRIVGD